VSIFEEFLELVRAGNTLQTALEKLAEGSTGPAHAVIDHLRRLERRIEDLEKENHALRDIVQKYLAEMEKHFPWRWFCVYREGKTDQNHSRD